MSTTILDFFNESELASFNSNPTMDVTAIIKRAFTSGVKRLNFLDLELYISLNTTFDTLANFTSGDIELYGNGACLIDTTTYLKNDKIIALFTLNNNVSSFKSNISYKGKILSNLSSNIGYVGATYVYSIGQNKNIEVNARIENLRYGILAGSYSDPSIGGASHIRGRLECRNIGYPIATYLANDIELEVQGDGFHRVAYIAGADHAIIKARTKNYYIAPIAIIFSDAKTGQGTSKGCKDCHAHIVDLGSTEYVQNGHLTGIALSRVDPNTIFDNITLDASITGTDTQATKLGHSVIISSVRTIWPDIYETNWIDSIQLKNVKITGIIDRSNQTVAEHASGEIYICPIDDVSKPGQKFFPTVSNFSCKDIVYRPGSGSKPRGFWFMLYGLNDQAIFERLWLPNNFPLLLRTNANSNTKIINSKILGVDLSNSASLDSKITFIDSEVYGGESYLPRVNKRFLNTKVGIQECPFIQVISAELVLSGASVSWFSALPKNALIFGISFIITENISGTRGVKIGDNLNNSKFYNSLTTSQGAGQSIANSNGFPFIQLDNMNIVVSAKENEDLSPASFTGGKLRIAVSYMLIPLPNI